ncbi:MAG TPA: DUF433 domain-containing protein [Longimicrobium sp.]|nr:DUF433 domain-containing protein [Longimicrobium sp.]
MNNERPIRLPNGDVVHSDPEIMGGTPVFVGTRVPPEILMEWIEDGGTLDDFLENFPTVRREQAILFLHQATAAVVARVA